MCCSAAREERSERGLVSIQVFSMAIQFTAEQIAQYRAAFNLFDLGEWVEVDWSELSCF